jgi:hypothetical protein
MQIWLLCDVPISTIIINPGYCSLATFVQLIFFRFIGSCVANRYIFMLPGIKYILLYFIISSNYHWFRIIMLCIADWILSYICSVDFFVVSLFIAESSFGSAFPWFLCYSPCALLVHMLLYWFWFFSCSATGPANSIAPLQASTYANCN